MLTASEPAARTRSPTPAQPPWTIGQVYDALDRAAEAAYYRAIALTRGSTVEVSSLILALRERAEELGELGGVFGGGGAFLAGAPEYPLVNSTELRKLLYLALTIAAAQAVSPPRITLPILATAAILEIRRAAPTQFATICSRVGIVLPADLQLGSPASARPAAAPRAAYGSTAPARTITTPAVRQPLPTVDELVADWLQLQECDSSSARAALMAKLNSDVSRI